jgi:hypothetical protein
MKQMMNQILGGTLFWSMFIAPPPIQVIKILNDLTVTTLSLEAEVDVAADKAAVEVAVDADKAVGRLLAPARHNERQLRDDQLVAGRQIGGAPVRQKVGRARRVVDVGGVAVRGELHQLVAGPGSLLLAPGLKKPG